MSEKTYKFAKIITAFLLAMIVSISITINSYIIPLIAVAAAMALMIGMKKNVKAVVADEMDYYIAGNAARLSITIYSITAMVLSVYFMAERGKNPIYELLGSIFAYSTCALIILQSLIFKLMRNRNYAGKDENKN